MNRKEFNETIAPKLAKAVGAKGERYSGPSERFFWLSGDDDLTVVVGPDEERACDLAMPYGLYEAKGRGLGIVLPADQSGATVLRRAWLKSDSQPKIWTYRDFSEKPRPVTRRSRKHLLGDYASWMDAGDRSTDAVREDDFRKASTPRHLGKRADLVHAIVQAVAERDELDPGHRRGYRAWHYRGQKVLQMETAGNGTVVVTAGIQNDENKEVWRVSRPASPKTVTAVLEKVDEAVHARQHGEFHKRDEHWLQNAIGRNPRWVGIEGRALREVPAWRRTGAEEPIPRKGAWSRGYIDLLGVDAHGTIQIVETKLDWNDDPLFGFQGVDYLAYCEAYRYPITRRLDVVGRAPMAIRYVLGTKDDAATAKLNHFAAATLRSLAADVQFSVMGLADWFKPPRSGPSVRTVKVEPKVGD